MPNHVQTQTLTVTLNNYRGTTPKQLIESLLDRHDAEGASYILTAETVIVTEEETDAERQEREQHEETERAHRTRNIKLLELQGWLYGENEKKKRGLPSEWDQNHWGAQTPCGTQACIAGKTVLDAGGKFIADEANPEIRGGIQYFASAEMPDGQTVVIETKAAELLGLNGYEEHGPLFQGGNNYELAAAVIDALIAGEDAGEARRAVMDAQNDADEDEEGNCTCSYCL